MNMDKFEQYLRGTNLSENTIASYSFAVKQYYRQYDTVTKGSCGNTRFGSSRITSQKL